MRLWPRGLSDFSKEDLQKIPDHEFSWLKQQLRKRAKKRTNSTTASNAIAREIEVRRRSTKRTPFTKRLLLAKFKTCEIMDVLVRNRRTRWEKSIPRRKKLARVDASNFSFLDNPEATLRTLRRIAECECDAASLELNFVDDEITDIGPFLVLGLMHEKMAPIISGGLVSAPTMKVLDAVGLRKVLKMRRLGIEHMMRDVWALPLQRRHAGGTSATDNLAMEPSRVEITADQITNHIDDWLSKIDPKARLTVWGASRIKAFVGEILNNAERHGRTGGDGEWISAGFMARREVEIEGLRRHVHVCHLCFFNPGQSVAQSIGSAPFETTRQISQYRRRHRMTGLHHDTLSTVFALQDGISRVAQGDDDPTGGTGIMDVVEFANEVGRANHPELAPIVAIVSGMAYIKFYPPYNRGIPAGDGEPRLQWFNADNSVMTAPDRSHVTNMSQLFPGTLVTLRFTLDGSFRTGEEN